MLVNKPCNVCQVCIDKLHDVQLALVIARLYDGDDMMTSEVRKILFTYVLGCDENGQHYREEKVNADPFLRSMGYWMIKDYRYEPFPITLTFAL